MLIKTIDSDNYIIYNSFDEIPVDDLEYIWYLFCSDENLTNIDFINNIPIPPKIEIKKEQSLHTKKSVKYFIPKFYI